jgi:hypothetical protein
MSSGESICGESIWQCPNFGARLCEPQLVTLQIKPLRVTGPRSIFKLGHCRPFDRVLI